MACGKIAGDANRKTWIEIEGLFQFSINQSLENACSWILIYVYCKIYYLAFPHNDSSWAHVGKKWYAIEFGLYNEIHDPPLNFIRVSITLSKWVLRKVFRIFDNTTIPILI